MTIRELSRILFILSICAGLSIQAQGPRRPGGPPPDGRRGPDGPGRGGADFLSVETRFDPQVVKDTPYTAQAVIEHTQTLGDGTRIQRLETAAVYRDSAGRTRREQTIKGFGPISVEGQPLKLVFISDPAAGFNYVLHTDQKEARQLPQGRRPGPPPGREPEGGDKENLGKQLIEGVEAEGTRITVNIPAGEFGNDRPLRIVSERWYSPALQVTVMSRHSDPRFGESVYRLTNIKRTEPARELFTVPADYRLQKDEGPHRRERRENGHLLKKPE
jgi:hypothetical protein